MPIMQAAILSLQLVPFCYWFVTSFFIHLFTHIAESSDVEAPVKCDAITLSPAADRSRSPQNCLTNLLVFPAFERHFDCYFKSAISLVWSALVWFGL